MTYQFPETRFVTDPENSLAKQIGKVLSEANEVDDAFCRGLTYADIALELLDTIQASETTLRMLERIPQANIDVDDLRDHVIAKNRSRGYYP